MKNPPAQKGTENQSRREVQRRFPPGMFVVSRDKDRIVAMVVGWASVAASVNPVTGAIRNPTSWEVLLLMVPGNTLKRESWYAMKSKMNIDEWEDWLTTP